MAAGSWRKRGASIELKVYVGRDPLDRRKVYRTKTMADAGSRANDKALSNFVTEVIGHSSAGGHTFGELIEAWYTHCAGDWSPTTAYNTRLVIDRRLGGLAERDLRSLTTKDLDDFYAALRARGGRRGTPLATATVLRTHTIVRLALDQARRWDWLDANPAALARPGRARRAEIRPPSPDDVARLAAAAADSDPEMLVYVTLLAELGGRRSEVGALRWSDRRPGAKLHIGRALAVGLDTPETRHRYAGHIWPAAWHRGTRPMALIEKEPKNRNSVRTIALSAGAGRVLDDLRRHQAARALMGGIALPDDGFIFGADVEGSRPLRPDSWTHRFITLRATVGLERVRLHDLRHFVATTLLAAGVDLTTVAGRLGHGQGGQTTLAIYAHFLAGGAPDQAAAELMSEILGRAAGTPDDGKVVPLRAPEAS